MMERLRDQRGSADPLLSRAAEILSTVRPLEPSVERRERVRAALASGAAARPWGAYLLRPAVAFSLLVLGSAALAALVWLALRSPADRPSLPPLEVPPGRERSEPPRTVSPPPVTPAYTPDPEPARQRRAGAPPSRHVVRTEELASGAPPAVDVATRPELPEPAIQPAEPVRTAPEPADVEPERPAPAAPAVIPDPKEAALLLEAVRALRRARNPARAISLVEEYARRYPEGSLLEEALGLGLEATAATNDRRGAAFAVAYLHKFPSGRFRAAALRARARFAR